MAVFAGDLSGARPLLRSKGPWPVCRDSGHTAVVRSADSLSKGARIRGTGAPANRNGRYSGQPTTRWNATAEFMAKCVKRVVLLSAAVPAVAHTVRDSLHGDGRPATYKVNRKKNNYCSPSFFSSRPRFFFCFVYEPLLDSCRLIVLPAGYLQAKRSRSVVSLPPPPSSLSSVLCVIIMFSYKRPDGASVL